jgi:hypothetical protein
MKLLTASALCAGALASSCAASCASSRVDRPPPPPAHAQTADVRAPATAEVLPDASAETPASATADAQESKPSAAPAAEQAQGETPAATPARLPKAESPPLGWIAGKPLEAEELLLEWGDAASREMWLMIDKLVASRLALSEAERLGIRLAPEAVDQRFAAEREKLEKEVARSGKKLELEKFIERELGFEPARYLERVRRATIRQMLAERAVRAASLAGESVALRLIVVANDEQKQAVEAALAAGRDFGEVARELSIDDSKRDGGLVPFVVQDSRSNLARLAFQTAVGEVAGPLPIADHHFWIRVEERRAPKEGDWAAIEAPVEASLARWPVDSPEFVHWKLTMEGRYPIDLGPLWSLVGAAK